MLEERILLFDGAMGTMLQKHGLKSGMQPELLNFTNPEDIIAIHAEYAAAGADVVSANTFQANRYKLANNGYTPQQVVAQAVSLAKTSGKAVALDIGPTGQLLEPMGMLTFEEAYDAFAEQMIAGEKAGADLIIIETMSDLYEVKAAILAAKENTNLPIFCTMSYDAGGRTFTGTDPASAAITISSLGVDALGVNCSLGPWEVMPIVEELLKYSSVPVMVQPNAGLPKVQNGETVYDISQEDFASQISKMLDMGARIIGGCCGTDPSFISMLAALIKDRKPAQCKLPAITAASSSSKTVILSPNTVVAELINLAENPEMRDALLSGEIDDIAGEAIDHAQNGADILNINIALDGVNELELMPRIIKEVQAVTNLTVQIESQNPAAIEAGIRAASGRPIINAANASPDMLEEIIRIAKKYGAVLTADK